MSASFSFARSPFTGWQVAARYVGPTWFTIVMGTGILAITLRIAFVDVAFFKTLALGLFIVDVALGAAFAGLFGYRLVTQRGAFGATLRDVAVAQTWGAPPMACFTVATGFLTIGASVLPATTCVAVAQSLYLVGVAGSLFSAGVVPFLMFTEHEIPPGGAVGSWLLPIVPPIVASVPAALLSSSWPQTVRPSMLAVAYALLGIGLLLAAIVISVFYARLVYAKVPEAALVTTTWLVIGPLGQGTAGIVALGEASRAVWPSLAGGLLDAGVVAGLLLFGLGFYWLAMATALTIRASRRGLPFTLGWWAFTFPVGTLASGSFALGRVTHAGIFHLAGLACVALLAAAWAIVSTRSLRRAWETVRCST